ncbi:MAG TPA: hypothetical protein PLE87_21775, partial [Phycisphaerae bacterium]|nr:hypothetical protein [Phycisphaerae bacterium]
MAKLISLEEAYGSTTAVAPKRRLISLSEAYGPDYEKARLVQMFRWGLVNADPADYPDYEGPNLELERLRQLER